MICVHSREARRSVVYRFPGPVARYEAVRFGRRQQGLGSSHCFRGSRCEKLVFSNISACVQRYSRKCLTDFVLDHSLVARSSSHFQSHCPTTRCRHSKHRLHCQTPTRTFCWPIVAARCWMNLFPTHQTAQGDCSWSAAESVSFEDRWSSSIAICETYR